MTMKNKGEKTMKQKLYNYCANAFIYNHLIMNVVLFICTIIG